MSMNLTTAPSITFSLQGVGTGRNEGGGRTHGRSVAPLSPVLSTTPQYNTLEGKGGGGGGMTYFNLWEENSGCLVWIRGFRRQWKSTVPSLTVLLKCMSHDPCVPVVLERGKPIDFARSRGNFPCSSVYTKTGGNFRQRQMLCCMCLF